MTPTRSQLLASASSLCDAFAAKAPISDLLSHFSTTHQVTAYEHGLPCLAPFLGRPFNGLSGIEGYFRLLQKYLTYENMSFSEWVVDTEARKVTAKGSAKFVWIEGKGEGQSWEEEFVYILDFDDQSKVTDYQVWGDTGAAYLAGKGELDNVRAEHGKSTGAA